MVIWWFGVDLAQAYMKNDKKIFFKDIKYQFAALTIVAAISFFIIDIAYIGYLWLAFLVGFGWYKARWIFFKYTIGIFYPFGAISYVIYIAHWPLVCQANYLSFIGIPYLEYALYMGVCILFSYILERKIYPPLNLKFLKTMFPAKYARRDS